MIISRESSFTISQQAKTFYEYLIWKAVCGNKYDMKKDSFQAMVPLFTIIKQADFTLLEDKLEQRSVILLCGTPNNRDGVPHK